MVLLFLRQPDKPKLPISNLPENLEVDREEASVDDLMDLIHKETKLPRSRLKLFLASSKTVLLPHSPLQIYDMHDGTRVLVKDLGRQINRKTLLLTAYSGPLFIHILFYYCQTIVYGTTFQHTASQVLAFTLVSLHFAKRIFETVFVHVFYRISVSFYSLYLYILHYWVLSGVFMAYYIYYPACGPAAVAISSLNSDRTASLGGSTAMNVCSSSLSLLSSSMEVEDTSLYFLSAVWIFAELSNFETHLILASLRIRYPRTTYSYTPRLFSDSSRVRALASSSTARITSPFSRTSSMSGLAARRMPKGYGFDLVSCPNYFFELLSWTSVTLITRSFASLLFLVASGLQMWRKAAKKHEMYKKEFGAHYPKFRKVLIPFVK
ncbi:3-oxo-5-alpha-steroid 4-dehydrogenase-domain-containing protein [Lipomyces arxii]|uniref:3-oxo-5-alpha-steroid 4-dehydrogenase-domain-containing protein n=1 Tax=Lipomyces arxii TaxID=56418 RepID=UPI0034CF6CCE